MPKETQFTNWKERVQVYFCVVSSPLKFLVSFNAVPSALHWMKSRVDLQIFQTVMAPAPAASGHLYLHLVSLRGTSQAALSYRTSTNPPVSEKVGLEGQSMSWAIENTLNTSAKAPVAKPVQHLKLPTLGQSSTAQSLPFFHSFLGNYCQTPNGSCLILNANSQKTQTSLAKARPAFQSKNSQFGPKVKRNLASSCPAENMDWWAAGCAVASEGNFKHRRFYGSCKVRLTLHPSWRLYIQWSTWLGADQSGTF